MNTNICLQIYGSYDDLRHFFTTDINQKTGLEVCRFLDTFRKAEDQNVIHIRNLSIKLNGKNSNTHENGGDTSPDRLSDNYSTEPLKLPSVVVASMEERFLNKVMEVVEKNLSNTQFNIAFFAHSMGMSKIQLYRKLSNATGYSPNDFIRHIRLERAKELIQQKAGYIAEIAYQVGFSNLSYFTKCFKDKFGYPPSTYWKLFCHDKAVSH